MEHSSLPGQKVENEAVPIRKKLESMFRGGLKLFGPRDSKATGFDFGYGFLGGLGPSVRLGLITPFLVAIYRIHKLSAATPDNNLKEVGLVGGISLPLGGR